MTEETTNPTSLLPLRIAPEILADHTSSGFEQLCDRCLRGENNSLSLSLTYRRAGVMRESKYVSVNHEAISRFLTLAETICVLDNGIVTAVDQSALVFCAELLDHDKIKAVFETSKKISHLDFDIVFRKLIKSTVKKHHTKYTLTVSRNARIGGLLNDNLNVFVTQTIATTQHKYDRSI